MAKKLTLITILMVIFATAHAEEEKSQELAVIGANGAPVVAVPRLVPRQIPAGGGPVVVPVGPAVVPLRPRAHQKGRLLRHLLRERPGLLRRLIARRRGNVIPVLPTVPGEEGVLPLAEESFQGSYVAVSGRPGERTVHIVNGREGNFAGTVVGGPGYSGHSPNPATGQFGDYDYVFDLDSDGSADFFDGPQGARPAVPGFEPLGEPRPGLITQTRNKVGFSPLPRCTYINTDIYGDDVGDGKGLSAGSAVGCKEACAKLDVCQFWTYRDGWARDCYLKRGRRGDPTSANAVPKVGYVSGTKSDVCVCLPNSSNGDEEVCPISYSKPIYPWKPRKGSSNSGRDRDNGRCTDANGVVIPCASDRNCFDANGIRIPGCRESGRRGNGDGGRGDGGVYRYDYDDYDIKTATVEGTPVGRSRCVDANGVVIPCNSDGIDDGIQEVVTARPIGGRRQRGRLSDKTETSGGADDVDVEVPGEDL